MSFSLLIQLILSVPNFIDLINSLIGFVKGINQQQKESKNDKAIENLQKAKTESEVKNAAKDYLSNS